MKENILIGFLAALLAAGAAYLRELIVPVIVLLCVMLADYVTGMARAWITSTLSSRVGVRGIVKKLAYMFCVAVGIVVDWIIQSAADKVGVDLGGFYFMGLLVTIWLILNELISILENVSEIGAPVPGFLLKLIRRLKKTAEEKGDEAAAGTQRPAADLQQAQPCAEDACELPPGEGQDMNDVARIMLEEWGKRIRKDDPDGDGK